jgi:hypothetical protein
MTVLFDSIRKCFLRIRPYEKIAFHSVDFKAFLCQIHSWPATTTTDLCVIRSSWSEQQLTVVFDSTRKSFLRTRPYEKIAFHYVDFEAYLCRIHSWSATTTTEVCVIRSSWSEQ